MTDNRLLFLLADVILEDDCSSNQSCRVAKPVTKDVLEAKKCQRLLSQMKSGCHYTLACASAVTYDSSGSVRIRFAGSYVQRPLQSDRCQELSHAAMHPITHLQKHVHLSSRYSGGLGLNNGRCGVTQLDLGAASSFHSGPLPVYRWDLHSGGCRALS